MPRVGISVLSERPTGFASRFRTNCRESIASLRTLPPLQKERCFRHQSRAEAQRHAGTRGVALPQPIENEQHGRATTCCHIRPALRARWPWRLAAIPGFLPQPKEFAGRRDVRPNWRRRPKPAPAGRARRSTKAADGRESDRARGRQHHFKTMIAHRPAHGVGRFGNQARPAGRQPPIVLARSGVPTRARRRRKRRHCPRSGSAPSGCKNGCSTVRRRTSSSRACGSAAAKPRATPQPIDCPVAAHESDVRALDGRQQSEPANQFDVDARRHEAGAGDGNQMRDIAGRTSDFEPVPRWPHARPGQAQLGIHLHSEAGARPMKCRRYGRCHCRSHCTFPLADCEHYRIPAEAMRHDGEAIFYSGPAIKGGQKPGLFIVGATNLAARSAASIWLMA